MERGDTLAGRENGGGREGTPVRRERQDDQQRLIQNPRAQPLSIRSALRVRNPHIPMRTVIRSPHRIETTSRNCDGLELSFDAAALLLLADDGFVLPPDNPAALEYSTAVAAVDLGLEGSIMGTQSPG